MSACSKRSLPAGVTAGLGQSGVSGRQLGI